MGFTASFRELTGSLVPFSSAPSCQDAPTHHSMRWGAPSNPPSVSLTLPPPPPCVCVYPSLAEVLGLYLLPLTLLPMHTNCSNPEIHINLSILTVCSIFRRDRVGGMDS
ncbi:hypothetical protein B9Q06_10020 [Candidatus Marsarchaeota G2 archaeon ECH_B_2]|uniref:Uncharacterized protein n=3 Tax=Candidatus Marsarchaeota group 2 TaxID=2203771 RepID=A0A2R6B6D0_9ARCH|nr:MAG: hypothetical protein B9Q06_10020 [Candidatus Marsarchaeota G2 archaeon ECH_B_2]PSN98723.1 MAG: hypothetical protein B9Q07_08845 [Candidatus Marsarchaeota G2 archaeon ECH_B_3]PSO00678.1 MAG: hypothetical protein B9Q05_10215 [Candidatus Marsarchaeota G2 archaeon ECH_B_1]